MINGYDGNQVSDSETPKEKLVRLVNDLDDEEKISKILELFSEPAIDEDQPEGFCQGSEDEQDPKEHLARIIVLERGKVK